MKLKLSKKLPEKRTAAIAAMFCALCICFAASISVGGADMGIVETLKAALGFGDARSVLITREIRLPRVATALFGGMGLAVTGCVLQCVLRNPLASASTLGISQGAAFGAAFAKIVLGAGSFAGSSILSGFSNPLTVAVCAFIGSSISAVSILFLSKARRSSPESMILCGVALSAMFAGATALIQYFGDEIDVASVVFWTFGDLGRASKIGAFAISMLSMAALAVCLLQRWNLNALEYGDDTALSLGVKAARFRTFMLLLCTLVAAVTVSFVGIINFVGLIAPHIARRLVGNAYAYLLPASAIMGAVLLLLGDIAARTLAAPIVLPIGALTSILGAPIFLYLLVYGGRAR